MVLRIASSILLLFSVLFMPFWVSIILTFAGMAYFERYVEAVVLLFLSDLLYGTPVTKFWGLFPASLIISFLFLVIIEFTKKRVRFYK